MTDFAGIPIFRYVPTLDVAPAYLDGGQLVHVVTELPTTNRVKENPDE